MFRRLRPPDEPVTIYLDDRPVTAAPTDTVAAALLAAGIKRFRGAPYCLIGNCFECRVEIDGLPDQQACVTIVTNGMRIRLHGPAG